MYIKELHKPVRLIYPKEKGVVFGYLLDRGSVQVNNKFGNNVYVLGVLKRFRRMDCVGLYAVPINSTLNKSKLSKEDKQLIYLYAEKIQFKFNIKYYNLKVKESLILFKKTKSIDNSLKIKITKEGFDRYKVNSYGLYKEVEKNMTTKEVNIYSHNFLERFNYNYNVFKD